MGPPKLHGLISADQQSGHPKLKRAQWMRLVFLRFVTGAQLRGALAPDDGSVKRSARTQMLPAQMREDVTDLHFGGEVQTSPDLAKASAWP